MISFGNFVCEEIYQFNHKAVKSIFQFLLKILLSITFKIHPKLFPTGLEMLFFVFRKRIRNIQRNAILRHARIKCANKVWLFASFEILIDNLAEKKGIARTLKYSN